MLQVAGAISMIILLPIAVVLAAGICKGIEDINDNLDKLDSRLESRAKELNKLNKSIQDVTDKIEVHFITK